MPRPAAKAMKKNNGGDAPVPSKKKDVAAALAAFDFFEDEDENSTNDADSNASPLPPPGPTVEQMKKAQAQAQAQAQAAKSAKPAAVRSRKRDVSEIEEDDDIATANTNGPCGDFGSEMQKMLEGFGADLHKTVNSKKKRLEQFTSATIRSSNKKVEDIWRGQQASRQKMTEEYCKQVTSVYTQWETDLEKVREQEEKLQNLLKQQQKLSQQTRVIQSQRLKTIKQLHEEYSKSMAELEQMHVEQQTTIQSELKKEMALLQKRILMDTQQQEMATVRKSLQSMLF